MSRIKQTTMDDMKKRIEKLLLETTKRYQFKDDSNALGYLIGSLEAMFEIEPKKETKQ